MNDEQTRDRTKIDENMMQQHIAKLEATGWYGLAEEVRIVLEIALLAGGVITNHLAEISRLHELHLERTKATDKIIKERDGLYSEVATAKELHHSLETEISRLRKERDALRGALRDALKWKRHTKQELTLEQLFFDDVATELVCAREKFPTNEHMLAALFEEAGEVANALLEHDRDKRRGVYVWNECVQTAAMCLRVAVDGDASFKYKPPVELPTEWPRFIGGSTIKIDDPSGAFDRDETDETSVITPEIMPADTIIFDEAGDITPEMWAGEVALTRAFFECGSCACLHRVGWEGDCRDDMQRFEISDLSQAELDKLITLGEDES